jgi:hypothetical protein
MSEFKKEMIEEISKKVLEKIRVEEKGEKDKEKEMVQLFLNIQEKQKRKELDIILDLKKELLQEQELKNEKKKSNRYY